MDQGIGLLRDVIIEVLNQAEGEKARLEQSPGDALCFGRMLAYAEVLSLLKDTVLGHEELEKLLDFDMDKKYLCKRRKGVESPSALQHEEEQKIQSGLHHCG